MLISVRVSGSSPFPRVVSVLTRYAASLSLIANSSADFAFRPLYFLLNFDEKLPLTLFLFLLLLVVDQWIFKRTGLSKYRVFLGAPEAVNSLQKDDR